jgi:hypothetical protein
MAEALQTGADLWVFGVTLVIWIGLVVYLARLNALLGAARGGALVASAALAVLVVFYFVVGPSLAEEGRALVVALNLLLWTRVFDLLLETQRKIRAAEASEEDS